MDCKLLSLSVPIIVPTLAHMFNLSLRYGIVPLDLKLSRSHQFIKTKDLKIILGHTDPTISVIPNIAKITKTNW